MFTTIDHRQMVSEFPDALEGTKSWSSIEVTHQLPWLYATFVVRVGGLMRARFLLTFSVAELEPSTLIGAEDGDLLSVMLVSPPGLNGTDKPSMDALREIRVAKVKSTGAGVVVYTLLDGRQVVSSKAPVASLCDFQRIFFIN